MRAVVVLRRVLQQRRGYVTDADRGTVIVSATRTPIGSLMGKLASMSMPRLGAVAIKDAVQRAGITPAHVEEVYFGNVVGAGAGQAPARQATIFAGLPKTTVTTTINKVCASGMKSVMLASQNIALGVRDVMVAGGMESMSNIPYYLLGARSGLRLGHGQLRDGILHDGLWDVYDDHHMGNCGEHTAAKFSITREEQDEYALESYARAVRAQTNGWFNSEIVPVTVPGAKDGQGTVVDKDEEPGNLRKDKVATLRPAFQKNGTVTAANSSKLNDGASALVLMSVKRARELGLRPLARVRGFADAEREPIEFPIAPADAMQRAYKHAGIAQSDVDFFEINEAFSVVALANAKILGLDLAKLNVHGGAVSLGHPIGSSGARIIVTLANVLKQHNGSIGVASICNGGGGASAIVIERLN